MNEYVKNTMANFLLISVMIITTWVLNPYLLAGLGSLQFAIWKSSQKFIELASGLDGGAVQSLKWSTAKDSSEKNSPVHKENFDIARKILHRWTPIGAAAVALVALVEINFLKESQTNLKSQVIATVLLAGMVSVMGLYAQLYESILIGFRLGYAATTLRVFALIVTNWLMVYAAQKNSGMLLVAACFALNILLISIGFIHFGKKFLQGSKSKFSSWGYRQSRIYGKSVWIWEFAQRWLLSWELLLFTVLRLPTVISTYVFSTFIFQFGLAVTLQSVSALTPRLASLINSQNKELVLDLIFFLRKISLALGSLILIVMIFLNEYLVTYWIGSDFYFGTLLNIYFALAFFQLIIIRVDSQIIDSTLNIQRKVKLTISTLAIGTASSLFSYFLTSSLVPALVIMFFARLFLNVRMPALVSDSLFPIKWPRKEIVILSATFMSAILINLKLLDTLLSNLIVALLYFIYVFFVLFDRKTLTLISALFRRGSDDSR